MPVFKSVNKNFFKKWNHQMAYVLGFFAADGYITVNKRGGQFWCIQINDKDLLFIIKKVIKAEHKINIRLRKKSTEKTSYRLQIGSKEMCEDLRSLGFSERKTRVLEIPNVPAKYLTDFVRGYFDGDGNVWVGIIHKDRKTPSITMRVVFTSSTHNFLNDLLKKLDFCGIHNGNIFKSKGNYSRLQYSIKSSLKLYCFMYNKECLKNKLYLSRKKKIFEKYVKLKNAGVA